ncbi:MAG: arylsulfatase, partial [Verrucomicrobia bacterium]
MLRAIIYLIAVASKITSATAASADWDRTVLPRPSQPFQGVANRTLEGSKASFTEPVKAPPGAPNILLVLIDDAGFGNPSTFGGPVATPTLDKL